ncbi:TetR/AcrR family transcriptional regulator [Demequina aestuarii]|uniref:TetR/AcrR family transcriptional regulator n=1 Tax=Demequina aestuarii TaxID=327095 RepID=UPI0007812B2B|nr:TetR/AcrR family transcriptional regulator [Demequina aestuarii]
MATPRGTNRGPSAGPQNRAALVAAARTVFDERGVDAPLSAVAKLAGVGQGSLYRHFPDRISLTVAVFEENLVEIERLSERPGSTMRDVLDLVTHQAEAASAFIETIAVARADARVAGFDARLRAVLARKWSEAAASGVGRAPGASVDDLMLAVAMVAMAVSHAPRSERHAVAERAWHLLAPGLRGEAPRAEP